MVNIHIQVEYVSRTTWHRCEKQGKKKVLIEGKKYMPNNESAYIVIVIMLIKRCTLRGVGRNLNIIKITFLTCLLSMFLLHSRKIVGLN